MNASDQTSAGWSDYLKSWLLYPLPQHGISRITYKLTRSETPWFKNAFIRWFAETYNIDWSQALYQQPEDYASFNAFFTRELKPGARPLEGDEKTVISPADGHISQVGRINSGSILQAKGHDFTVNDLLGGDAERAASFHDGSFITIYLSPRDYHRVHMPLSGRLRETVYIPGRLFSVAAHTVRTVPRLFARNERLVSIFDTQAGPMAVILVGAINVAAIETVWSGLVTPPHRGRIEAREVSSEGIELARGDEMGRFNMGSTVIVLFANNRTEWRNELRAENPLQMGHAIGRLKE